MKLVKRARNVARAAQVSQFANSAPSATARLTAQAQKKLERGTVAMQILAAIPAPLASPIWVKEAGMKTKNKRANKCKVSQTISP
jgi:hypothetical protein